MASHNPHLSEEELAARGRVLVAEAVAGTSAPLALRARLERDRTRLAPAARRRRGLGLGGVLAGAAAAVAAVVVLAASGGGAGGPTVAEATALGQRAPTAPAPAKRTGGKLAAQVGGVTFPDWQRAFPWRASGARLDRVGGRAAMTVFYDNPAGKRLAYTIVDGDPLKPPGGGHTTTVAGHPYRFLRERDRVVLTWQKGGHTCIVAAPSSLSETKLLALAGWEET